MNAEQNQITKPAPLTERVAAEIRKQLESGQVEVSGVLRSERELAERYGVGRITVRRALKRLVTEGYLVSRPRQGYRVAGAAARNVGEGLVAFVQDQPLDPWEWPEFRVELWDGFQRAAGEAGRSIMAIGVGERGPEELGRRLAAQGVAGAIVNAADPETAAAIRAAGLPVVRIDAADPESESVTQDNFGGAYRATARLVQRGRRRIAWLGATRDALHAHERLGGYLAALAEAGLAAPEEWRILCPPEKSPGRALLELARREDGPRAAVVLWGGLFGDVSRKLIGSDRDLDMVTWWGGSEGGRSRWKARFPNQAVPDGVEWSLPEMARLALERLEAIRLRPDRPPARTIVSARLVPGEDPS